jgi:hypothetical protein
LESAPDPKQIDLGLIAASHRKVPDHTFQSSSAEQRSLGRICGVDLMRWRARLAVLRPARCASPLPQNLTQRVIEDKLNFAFHSALKAE